MKRSIEKCEQRTLVVRSGRRAIIPLILSIITAIVLSPTPPLAGERALEAVVVTTRSLGLNHIVVEADVVIEQSEGVNSSYATTLRDVVGKRVKRPIGRNNMVKRGYLAKARVIRRGDRVVLIARMGNLKAITRGVARDGGAVGDTIVVENTSSGKMIRGTVRAPSMVDVRF
ncbi:MAG: flagellar basal body P-ring formation chaperone FlgA [Thermodesulfobacteriota bacterium]